MERQLLKHGKALCGKVFGGFVDTFNWLVRFCSNIRGDKDVSDANGHITVDLSDPDHPVIRCSGCSDSAGSKSINKCPHGKKLETHALTYTDKDGESHSVHGLFCDDISLGQLSSGVSSLNSQTGDISVIGGESIEVSTDGKTIRISYKESKEEEPETDPSGGSGGHQDGDPGPNGNCDNHPGSIPGGGVEAGGVGAGGGGDGGGVPSRPEDRSSSGVGCNC